MDILWLGPYKPVPGESGADLRSYYLMKSLKQQGATLSGLFLGSHGEACEQFFESTTVVNPDSWKQYLRAGLWRARGLPLSYGRYRQRELIDKIPDSSFLYVDHLHMTANLFPDFSRPFWLDNHNLEYVLWQEYAAERRMPVAYLYGLEAKKIRGYEFTAIKRSQGTGIPARLQQQRLPSNLRRKVSVISNGVPDTWLRTGEKRLNSKFSTCTTLGFIGSFSWPPNRLGTEKFIRQVWPTLRDQSANLELLLAGSAPQPDWKNEPGIRCLGRVNSSAEFFNEIDLLVVPLEVGSGTRLKILEAAARGVPVVATEKGVAGLEDFTVNAVSGIEAMGKEILEIIDRPARLRKLVEHNWRTASKAYRWSKIGEKLMNQLQTAVG